MVRQSRHEATGNGRLDAVSNALKKAYEMKFTPGNLSGTCT